MNKDQKEKIKQLLSSCNIDDINLAGSLIKEHLLKITDEDLDTFLELVSYAQINRGKDIRNFTFGELLKSKVQNISEEEVGYTWNNLTKLLSSMDSSVID